MFQDIQPILNRSIKRAGINSQVEAVRILDIFMIVAEKILPEGILEHIRPLYLQSGVLTIASLSDSAVTTLSKKEQELLSELNNQFEQPVVDKFRYLT
jgi:predicted nucleic acid-binding Zn ribbon protein